MNRYYNCSRIIKEKSNMVSMKQNATQPTKRFVVVSFLAAIALSTLCNSIFGIIESYSDNILSRPLDFVNALLYPASLMIFMIKYFVDDVIDERNDKEEPTRSNLALIVLGWIFFLLTAISATHTHESSILWAIGLIVVTTFLNMNIKVIGSNAKLYMFQNLLLLALLITLIFSTSNCSFVIYCFDNPMAWPIPTYFWTSILTLLNICFFTNLLCKYKTEPNTIESTTPPCTTNISVSIDVTTNHK
jgi:hypothetical protein